MIPSPGNTAPSDVGNFVQVANWKFTELGNSCTTGHGSWFVSQTVKLLDDRSHSLLWPSYCSYSPIHGARHSGCVVPQNGTFFQYASLGEHRSARSDGPVNIVDG